MPNSLLDLLGKNLKQLKEMVAEQGDLGLVAEVNTASLSFLQLVTLQLKTETSCIFVL